MIPCKEVNIPCFSFICHGNLGDSFLSGFACSCLLLKTILCLLSPFCKLWIKFVSASESISSVCYIHNLVFLQMYLTSIYWMPTASRHRFRCLGYFHEHNIKGPCPPFPAVPWVTLWITGPNKGTFIFTTVMILRHWFKWKAFQGQQIL